MSEWHLLGIQRMAVVPSVGCLLVSQKYLGSYCKKWSADLDGHQGHSSPRVSKNLGPALVGSPYHINLGHVIHYTKKVGNHYSST